MSELQQNTRDVMMAAAPRAAQDTTRPVYHFRPPAQWMNDVCAAFYHHGFYHIFFQLNPFSDQCCGFGWGHARSRNLVHWELLPMAIIPSEETGEQSAASGSACIRSDGMPMLFFTHTPIGFPDKKREAWGALPIDEELVSWRRIDLGLKPGQNGVPQEINALWADMFVFSIGKKTFATFKQSDGLVCKAQNQELTEWKAVGNLGGTDPHGSASLEGVIGECPNLFTLDGRQVLIRSTYPISYVLGDFDPEAIRLNTQTAPRVMDYAYGGDKSPDNFSRGLYGTTVFTDLTHRTILVGWVSGFKPNRGWNGCMSIPRVLSLKEDRLIQTPAAELRQLRGAHIYRENVNITDESIHINGAQGDALEIAVEFVPGNAAVYGLKVRCDAEGKDGISIRYAGGALDVDGTKVPLPEDAETRPLRLHLFLDRSVIELFCNDGMESVTRVSYAKDHNREIWIFAKQGSVAVSRLDVWQMASIWQNDTGIVEK